jgi:hypothetical protein
MPLFIALPPFASEFVVALMTLVATLGIIRVRRHAQPHDAEQAMRALTLKVRHPWTYRARLWAKSE